MSVTLDQLPNGPAAMTADLRKDKVTLQYAGLTILTATLKLERNGVLMSLKEGGARILAVSKSDGWDQVTQTVRIGAVAMQPGDILRLKVLIPTAPAVDGATAPEALAIDPQSATVYCPARDFQITLGSSEPLEWTTEPKLCVEGAATEFLVTFKPRYSHFH